MKTQTIAIIGLERLGASVALALKASPLEVRIIGHDGQTERARAAEKQGMIDSLEWSFVSAAARADIVILALPFTELEFTLREIGDNLQPHTLLIDMTRFKGPGQAWAQQFLTNGHYIGAVPILAARWLADGRTDLAAAQADLFKDSALALMAPPSADPQAVETAVKMGIILGAKPFFLDADEYDGLMAGVDAAPGLLAAALLRTVTARQSWRDTMRLAGAPFSLATLALENPADLPTLALHNSSATLGWIDALVAELQALRMLVADNDHDGLAQVAEELGLERELWLRRRERNDWQAEVGTSMSDVATDFNLLGGYRDERRRQEEQRKS